MKTVLFLAFVSICIAELKRHQNITVYGTVSCNGTVLPGITVQLKEQDFMSLDDNLYTTQTDENGTFYTYGEDNEVMDITPVIVLNHNCTTTPCNGGKQATTSFTVPAEYIGKKFNLTVDLHHVKDSEKKC